METKLCVRVLRLGRKEKNQRLLSLAIQTPRSLSLHGFHTLRVNGLWVENIQRCTTPTDLRAECVQARLRERHLQQHSRAQLGTGLTLNLKSRRGNDLSLQHRVHRLNVSVVPFDTNGLGTSSSRGPQNQPLSDQPYFRVNHSLGDKYFETDYEPNPSISQTLLGL